MQEEEEEEEGGGHLLGSSTLPAQVGHGWTTDLPTGAHPPALMTLKSNHWVLSTII